MPKLRFCFTGNKPMDDVFSQRRVYGKKREQGTPRLEADSLYDAPAKVWIYFPRGTLVVL